jgi:hypothetical protein
MATKTDHSADIAMLRAKAEDSNLPDLNVLIYEIGADLLEMHDRQSLSLDDWDTGRNFVELLIGHPITKNGV